MNTKNRPTGNPFRRGSGKKRPKGNGKRPANQGGRALPGAVGDLMSVMPSATKAVAQMVSGNTRPSGQVAHARNVLRQAQRAIDDRVTERLAPGIKDDFLEQVALLRLTLADAHEFEDANQQENEPEGPAPEADGSGGISMDRLRELALSIAGSKPAPEPAPQAPPGHFDDDEDDDLPSHAAIAAAAASLKADRPAAAAKPASTTRSLKSNAGKLRLKAVLDERRNSDDSRQG